MGTPPEKVLQQLTQIPRVAFPPASENNTECSFSAEAFEHRSCPAHPIRGDEGGGEGGACYFGRRQVSVAIVLLLFPLKRGVYGLVQRGTQTGAPVMPCTPHPHSATATAGVARRRPSCRSPLAGVPRAGTVAGAALTGGARWQCAAGPPTGG